MRDKRAHRKTEPFDEGETEYYLFCSSYYGE